MHWQANADLARLREPSALDKLPADERKDWLAPWDEVTNVGAGLCRDLFEAGHLISTRTR